MVKDYGWRYRIKYWSITLSKSFEQYKKLSLIISVFFICITTLQLNSVQYKLDVPVCITVYKDVIEFDPLIKEIFQIPDGSFTVIEKLKSSHFAKPITSEDDHSYPKQLSSNQIYKLEFKKCLCSLFTFDKIEVFIHTIVDDPQKEIERVEQDSSNKSFFNQEYYMDDKPIWMEYPMSLFKSLDRKRIDNKKVSKIIFNYKTKNTNDKTEKFIYFDINDQNSLARVNKVEKDFRDDQAAMRKHLSETNSLYLSSQLFGHKDTGY